MTAGTHADKNEDALRAHSEPDRSWLLPRVLKKIRNALRLYVRQAQAGAAQQDLTRTGPFYSVGAM